MSEWYEPKISFERMLRQHLVQAEYLWSAPQAPAPVSAGRADTADALLLLAMRLASYGRSRPPTGAPGASA